MQNNVVLYSSENTTRSLPLQGPQPTPPQDTDPNAYNRRAAFARVKQLTPYLLGLSETDVWAYYKDRANVKSRAELTPENWAIVAAELLGALQNYTLLQSLREKIWRHHASS